MRNNVNPYKPVFPRYKYTKAPLLEAIFEAKFSHASFDSAIPGQFYEKIRSDYPEKNDLKLITIAIGTIPTQSENIYSPPQLPSMQAWNKDKSSCLQIGPGIITANDKKYRSWEEFTPAINLLLQSYFECAKPLISKKVGVRCINRFLIPGDNVIISDFFCIGFALPNFLIESSAFDITLVQNFIHENYEINAKIRFATDTPKNEEKGIAFILDIESFVANDIPTEPKLLLEIASVCHLYLKDIFESILQNKMRELLEGVRQ